MIITIRKEGILCSLCLKEIEVGKKAFKFFNSYSNSNKNKVKEGYYNLPKGITHFRHMKCQYLVKPRKLDEENWINRQIYESELAKLRKKYLRKNKVIQS